MQLTLVEKYPKRFLYKQNTDRFAMEDIAGFRDRAIQVFWSV